MNILYGWVMSDYLPQGGFKWLKNAYGFDVNLISKKSEIEYVLEIDLEYADELNNLHTDLKLAVYSNMLSKYCKEIADKYETKVGDVKKINPKFR